MTIAPEQFPALSAFDDRIRHGFVGRIPDLDVDLDRETALARLTDVHREARAGLGLAGFAFVHAQQVHGAGVAIVSETPTATPAPPMAAVDALVTNQRGICLGIFVADCAAVYCFDPEQGIIGLAHSGKKGTELGVVTETLRMMESLGARPADVVVQISPCIRPPHYEVDFAAEIAAQCRRAGVRQIHDEGICTHTNVERYYSYRREKGRTGRMLAMLALREG